jgi:hypothetical protein
VGRLREPNEPRQTYDEWQLEFGRDNLIERGEGFLARLSRRLTDIDGFLTREGLQEKSKEDLLQRKDRLQKVLNNEID